MTQKVQRVGLIGLSGGESWATRSHLPYFNSTSDYEITALQNSSKASSEAAAKAHNLPNVSTHDNPKDLANDPNVDIVAVSVKVPYHHSLIKPALEAGKDAFVEWPLAKNLKEAEGLTKIAKEKGLRTLVGLQARQNPSVIKAKEIVESGKLGKILGTTLYAHAMIPHDVIPDHRAYFLDIENGANVLTIPFGHAVDALCYVLGEIDSLSSTLAINLAESDVTDKDGNVVRKDPRTSHDYVSITGTLVNGGVVDATYAMGPSRTGRNFHWEINGTKGSLVLECSHGHIQMFQPSIKLFTEEAPGKEVQVEEVAVEKVDGLDRGDFSYNVGRAWDALAGKGLDKGHSVTTFEDALLRHRMIEAIYRSAKQGTRERYL